MKKVLFIAVVAVVSLTSCKKDRVCTCTVVSTTGTTSTTSTEVTTMYKVTKGDARRNCIGSQTATTSGSITITGDKTTCTLK